MHVLHVSSDFCNTKVHTNLFKSLAEQGVSQTIYCPIRNVEQIGRNAFDFEGTTIVYDHIVKPYHRYVYHIKRQFVFKSLQQKVDFDNVDLCHAATLFTDGGQAYLLHKKYQIPYMVAVRNTDINGFLDKLPNTWFAGRKILRNARKIFFISKALMEKFSNHNVIKPILSDIQDKMMLIPNGIDAYYLENVSHCPHNGHKVLYVGDFSENKNVVRLCEAVLELRKEEGFGDIHLTLVGGGKSTNNHVLKIIKEHPNVINYLGPIHEKERLCEVFRNHSLFAMPSIHETFGLVYIEALSQNLPIIYTRGQGVDGLLPSTAGMSVTPYSVESIKQSMKTIMLNLNHYSNKNIDFEEYRWERIAEKYKTCYNELIT